MLFLFLSASDEGRIRESWATQTARADGSIFRRKSKSRTHLRQQTLSRGSWFFTGLTPHRAEQFVFYIALD